jgi:hypothetical protein
VRARLRALLLLALFLSAGTSLPSLDALFFHLHPDPAAGRIHIEPAGGCTAHAEHCTLGRAPAGSRAVTPLVIVIRFTADVRPALGPASADRAPAAGPLLLPLPRAPPVSSL